MRFGLVGMEYDLRKVLLTLHLSSLHVIIWSSRRNASVANVSMPTKPKNFVGFFMPSVCSSSHDTASSQTIRVKHFEDTQDNPQHVKWV